MHRLSADEIFNNIEELLGIEAVNRAAKRQLENCFPIGGNIGDEHKRLCPAEQFVGANPIREVIPDVRM